MAQSSSSAPALQDDSNQNQPIKWGADLKGLAACFVVGAVIWFVPTPQGLTSQAWQLFAVFVATILGIILQPVPLGAVAMIGLGAAMLTKTLTFDQAFSAFTNEIPWLIATAYWLAQGFISTGLGKRIAYNIVKAFGKTTIGMTYSLVIAEALVAPLMPSVAARSGGIFFPLAKALCLACGSDPEKGTEKKMGAYVMLTCFLGTTISSGMFLTAMAANPLTANLAQQTLGYTISWGMWAKSAILPGAISLLLTPLILYFLYAPELKSTPQAPDTANAEL